MMLRIPEGLQARLVREVGERMARTARPTSLNRVVIEILEKHFRAQDKMRRREE